MHVEAVIEIPARDSESKEIKSIMIYPCFPSFCPDEGKCFSENVRHILKFFRTMKVFVILWLFKLNQTTQIAKAKQTL